MPTEVDSDAKPMLRAPRQGRLAQPRETIPTRLEIGGGNSTLPLPVRTSKGELPISKLRWDDFERLCLRLARTRDEVAECRLYGHPGDEQHGIDLYASLTDGRGWRLYQCKHVQKLTPKLLAAITDKFIQGDFTEGAVEFVLCTTRSLRSAALDDAWRKEASRLKVRNIRAVRWDAEELPLLLREQPRLVFDFFGPAWFEEFAGQAPREFARRLTAEQVGTFRRRCRQFYGARVDRLDPGLPLGYREESFRLPLAKRFVEPDVLVSLPAARTGDRADRQAEAHVEPPRPEPRLVAGDPPPARPRPRAQDHPAAVTLRSAAAAWLGRSPRQILLGEPGIGKSTLLRFLALDLLADEPGWGQTARVWGEMLPVWVPFPFWTAQIGARHGSGVTLPELLRQWLEQEHQGELWPLVSGALEDERLLLLVDGLDEYHDEAAAGVALQQLLSFLDAHPVPALMVSRPLGFAPLRGALTGWSVAEISPLSVEQQDRLAGLWFQADARRHGHPAADTDDAARRRAQDFRGQLESARELGELAGVPLLLGLMVRLNLDGAHLPTSRREACERLATLLLDEHPRRRREAARLTGATGQSAAHRHQIDSRDKRRAFAALALTAFQERPTGTLKEGDAVRWIADFLCADDDGICLDRADAHAAAREFLAQARAELGLLVETANGQFGFFHRLIQEWLAAERLRDLGLVQQREIVRRRAVHPQWRETLLGFFQTLPAESLEVFLGDLETMWQAASRSQRDEIELVLAATVFGDTQINGRRRRELMDRSFRLIERHDDVKVRERVLQISLASLGGRNVLPASVVRTRVQSWFPARKTYREQMLGAIGNWSYDPAALDVLLRNLHDDGVHNVRAAAGGIGKMAAGNADAVEHLCGLARSSESSLCRVGALEALRGCLPSDDPRLVTLARWNRDCGAPDAELVAVGILIQRGEHTDADRKRMLRAGRWAVAPDLGWQWRLELAWVLAAGWPGDPVVRAAAVRAFQCEEHRLSGRLEREVAFLVLLAGFPKDEWANAALIEQLGNKHLSVHFDVDQRRQMVARMASGWQGSDALMAAMEAWLEQERSIRGFGNLEFYHFAKTDSMKGKLLGHLRSDTTFLGLELHALINVWGLDDSEALAGCKHFVNHTANGYLRAQKHLAALADDASLARNALLEKLRPEVGIELSQVLKGLRVLDGGILKPDVVERCIQLRSGATWEWNDLVKPDLIAYGFPDPRVRQIALESFEQRGGDLGAVAKGWGADPEIRSLVLQNATALPDHIRSCVVEALEKLPAAEKWADESLARYDFDAELGVRCVAAAALAQRGFRLGTLSAGTIASFVGYLTAEGPNRFECRLVGLAGLLVSDRYEEIASFLEGEGFQQERTSSMVLHDGVRPLVKTLAQKWDGLSQVFDDRQLKLLVKAAGLDDHTLYQFGDILTGGSFAKWLYQQSQEAREPRLPDRRDLEAMAVMQPGNLKLRQTCLEMLRSEVYHGPDFDWWTMEHAAHLLARHGNIDGSLAEELVCGRELQDWGEGTLQALARGWPESEKLDEWIRWAEQRRHGLRWPTFWACSFAVSPADVLTWRLQHLDTRMNHSSAMAFRDQSEVLARRLARHADLAEEIAGEVMTTSSSPVLLTWLALLKNGSTGNGPFRQWLESRSEELARGTGRPARFGTDYSTGSLRNEVQLVAAIVNGR